MLLIFSNSGQSAVNKGKLKVYINGAWVIKPVKVWDGSNWVQKPVRYWNGSQWLYTFDTSVTYVLNEDSTDPGTYVGNGAVEDSSDVGTFTLVGNSASEDSSDAGTYIINNH